MSKFQIGDKVVWVKHPVYCGQTATIIATRNGFVDVKSDNGENLYGWLSTRFKLVPTSPFDAAVNDYIRSELRDV